MYIFGATIFAPLEKKYSAETRFCSKEMANIKII
jgi:hypothetical protein